MIDGLQLLEHVASRPFGTFVASACSTVAVSRHKGEFRVAVAGEVAGAWAGLSAETLSLKYYRRSGTLTQE